MCDAARTLAGLVISYAENGRALHKWATSKEADDNLDLLDCGVGKLVEINALERTASVEITEPFAMHALATWTLSVSPNAIEAHICSRLSRYVMSQVCVCVCGPMCVACACARVVVNSLSYGSAAQRGEFRWHGLWLGSREAGGSGTTTMGRDTTGDSRTSACNS